ncbi:hypothetical protein HKD28_06675 [Gluconobacter sp. LMG 1744]|uniref:hypothetical protein n=1 Tax=Gluconobacter cadivus TaxID=2728101 RepID=UPI0018853ED7|nr:hypothetical protein [Gluconobacter cadivus]MBF0891108.1 hypothetical protein [Gluconobacter cadivus]
MNTGLIALKNIFRGMAEGRKPQWMGEKMTIFSEGSDQHNGIVKSFLKIGMLV